MKSALRTSIFSLFIFLVFQLQLPAQTEEPSGLLGDHFSLESALEEFKKAKNFEAFEKAINDADNHIHNLDLNEDDKIDYILVNDHMEGDVHAIVLSAVINEKENQDIAVIEIEKDGHESATLQIVGDEDLYGKDMIVEPYDLDETDDGKGPCASPEYARIVVNVWFWPSVRWVYGPTYVVYRSPWRWAYYPGWWRPWRPLGWSVWGPYRVRYTPRYRVTPVRRVTHARVVYRPHRAVSKTVTVKHKTSITRAKSHKVTHTKTTTRVAGVKGNSGKAVATKKTKTVANKKGVKKTSKTKVAGKKGNTKVKGKKTTKVKKTKKGKGKGKGVKKKKRNR